MVHFVDERCVKCKYTTCVVLCPVDCFHEGDSVLVIDPDVCIDCGVCVDDCPVGAIVNDDVVVDGKKVSDILALSKSGGELTQRQRDALLMYDFNAYYSKHWPTITAEKEPLPEAEEFKTNLNKLPYLQHEIGEMQRGKDDPDAHE